MKPKPAMPTTAMQPQAEPQPSSSSGDASGGRASTPALLRTFDLGPGGLTRIPFNRKEAHRRLKEYRKELADSGLEVKDLTENIDFWKPYVLDHPFAEVIIGPGITRWEIRFLKTKEPNGHALLKELGAEWAYRRCDFIAHRVDGTCARIHPDACKEAKIITGQLSEWTEPIRASTPNDPRLIRTVSEYHYSRHGPVDIIGQEEARAQLQNLLRRAEGKDVNITDAALFDWERFFMGKSWGQELLKEGIEIIQVVNDKGGPSLVLLTKTNKQGRITFNKQTSKATVTWTK